MRSKKGFTLIELLVVISIIALLMAIMMPALSKVRNMARKIVCGSHMHNMGIAIENYKANNDGFYPIAYWSNNSFARRTYTESLIKADLIDGEETVEGNDEWVVGASSVREAYSCPSFRKFLERKREMIYGWGDNIAEHYPIGYGYNSHLSRYNSWNSATNQPERTDNWSYAGNKAKSDTLVLIDAASFFVSNTGGGRFYPVYNVSSRYVTSNGNIAGSHSGGISNSLWADMHVEDRRADEYFRRDPDDPSQLLGNSVLDHTGYKYSDRGYKYSTPKGSIACPE
ncbi:putative major pilin subunit [Limihaloglobus sulfuriphilus]|uniref:Putative major pilin subunit n=1 Tax=Limihaloglobus sulfuriphilus TaxID=1851148 RepID=A0A1Q2MG09_9BACT|nr:type II secretion system protein [Limihaloglobus sulfuriphilus]AQQ71635.1 putative major pilin subunit [Limihaloglobus sulfuriphilus]